MVSITVDKFHTQTNTRKEIGMDEKRRKRVHEASETLSSVSVKERSIYHDPRRATANPLGVAESH